MEEEAPNQERKKNPSQPRRYGLNPKAIKWKNKPQIKKQKNASQPKPDGLKLNEIKWKQKAKIKKTKKNHYSLDPTDLNQGQ